MCISQTLKENLRNGGMTLIAKIGIIGHVDS